jgi:hypothetical protein
MLFSCATGLKLVSESQIATEEFKEFPEAQEFKEMSK